MQSCELVTFVTALACAISQCYSDDELDVVASVFTQLGDTLQTIISNGQLCDKGNDSGEKSAAKDNVANT